MPGNDPFIPPQVAPVLPPVPPEPDDQPTGLIPPTITTTDPESVERTDQTLKSRAFRVWLRNNNDRDEYCELDAIINDSKQYFVGARWLRFSFDLYSEELLRADRPDLLEKLLLAETEWRADAAAAKGGRIHMGLKDAETVSKALLPLTPELPTIIVQCGWKDRNDKQCPETSIPGAIRCKKHGGEWLDPAVRQRLLMASYMKLVESSELAVEALVFVAVHGKREEARVMAAKEILDRAGIRAGVDIHHHIENGGSSEQVAALHAKLDAMAESMEARETLTASREEEIIDAEEVEPDLPIDRQPSLFDAFPDELPVEPIEVHQS